MSLSSHIRCDIHGQRVKVCVGRAQDAREVRQAQENLLHDADAWVLFDTVEREMLSVGLSEEAR